MISYEPLWETMERKRIGQYQLTEYYGVSAAQVGRLKKNLYVSVHTLEMLCKILDCRVEDVIEIQNK